MEKLMKAVRTSQSLALVIFSAPVVTISAAIILSNA